MGELIPSDEMHSKENEDPLQKQNVKKPSDELKRDGIQQSLRQGYFKVSFVIYTLLN